MTRRQKVTLALLVVLSLGLGSANLTAPFLHHNESSLTQVGKLARNYLKFGYLKSRFGVLDVSGPRLDAYDDHRKYHYASHPPLTYWLASLTLRAAPGETGVRLLPLLFMAGSVALLYLLARRMIEEPWATVAAAVFTTFPMIAYNSIATVHLPVVLFFVLAGLIHYLRWLESGRRRDFLLLVATQGAACAADWQGYYLAPVILLHLLLARRARWKSGAILVATNFAWFGLYLLFLLILDPDGRSALGHLFSTGGERVALRLSSLPRFLFSEARETALYFTVAASLLALVGLLKSKDRFLPCLLLLGLDEVLFIPYAAEHDYFTFCLAPFFALAAAFGARFAAQRASRGPKIALVALAAAYLGQAGLILANRWSKEGGYEFYYRLAGAINGMTRSEDKLVVLTEDIRFYTPYYADRYSVWYDRKNGELLAENSGGRRKPFGQADLARLLEENREGFRYAVTADRNGILRNVRFLAGADDALLRSFGVHDDDRVYLSGLCGPPLEKDGFLFWTLPHGP